ncbi:glycoside hydrolase family 5 protein [Sphingomonas sp. AOB5]|uniref:glycoside hydrolase family 5 protein n=1 Tax=Sphingomonas sp. AOB5 TaxID=3034017 RepID=UPI0023F80CA3|nr:glycoside hydrolase family 5 protein [Sphingomonas sp. AOB5]MDF7776622.1 glycoside hydrolase family 5 protein [Sphingomonas sp. AOB5]
MIRTLIAAGLGLAIAMPATAQHYVPAPAAKPKTGIALPIGKCVNMGNHMEPPNEGDWGRAIADDDFRVIKAAGFATIRLPVRWSTHALEQAPYTIDAKWMARVSHVVRTANRAGLNVILNLHNYDELIVEPDKHAERFAALWRQIGAAFADAPGNVWFELLNEPNRAIDNRNLLKILNPALAAVRASNPTRPVIIGGQNWSGVDSLATLELPDDPYVVPTIHTYDPFDFTHQGASWVDPSPKIGRSFPVDGDLAYLDGNLKKVRDYMARTGRVPFVGEYGAFDIPAVSLDQRIDYYRTISAAYASIGIQSCAWAYTNTFRLREGNKWIPGMIEAIRTTTTLQ